MRFLLSVGVAVLLSVIAAGLSAGPWRNTAEDQPKKLRVDHLVLAGNTGITVAGIAVPLIAGLAAYVYSQLSQSPHDVAFLVAGLIVTALSVLAGLWAVYSLATVAGGAETIEVHKKQNTYMGANLVLQLALLICGCALVSAYVVGLDFTKQRLTTSVEPSRPAVLRRHVVIGEPAAEVTRAWGPPDTSKQDATAVVNSYTTAASTIDVRLEGGVVVQITEKRK